MIDPVNEALYNNRALVPDHMDTIDWWARESSKTREHVACSLGVSYGSSERQTMDVFPASTPDAPIMVFIHGGYWQGLATSFFSFVAPQLNALGYCVAVVGYDLCPDVTVDDITRQIQKACSFIYEHALDYGANGNLLYVSGHSAGGHLTAAMMATEWTAVGDGLPRNLVKGAMSISGVFDLFPLVNTSINVKVGFDETSARQNSPILHKPVSTGPLALVVGACESQGFLDQSDRLRDAWADDLQFISRVDIADKDHFTVVSELARPNSPLIQVAASLLG